MAPPIAEQFDPILGGILKHGKRRLNALDKLYQDCLTTSNINERFGGAPLTGLLNNIMEARQLEASRIGKKR